MLEGLNDPENLGLIARSARAFGVDALLLDPTCIDPYYRRTVRVSMGEVLLLDVARCAAWPAGIDLLHDAEFETWAMTPDGDATSIWDLAVPVRLAIVLGAEGPGLDAARCNGPQGRYASRSAFDVDSLNVGHAAAIAFAVTRTPPREPPSGDDGTRTHNPHLAKVMRYQLRHVPGVPRLTESNAQSSLVATALGVTFIFGSYSASSMTRPSARKASRSAGPAVVARTVEALLHVSPTSGTRHVDRLHAWRR